MGIWTLAVLNRDIYLFKNIYTINKEYIIVRDIVYETVVPGPSAAFKVRPCGHTKYPKMIEKNEIEINCINCSWKYKSLKNTHGDLYVVRRTYWLRNVVLTGKKIIMRNARLLYTLYDVPNARS